MANKFVWVLIDPDIAYVVGVYDTQDLMWKAKENFERENKGSELSDYTRILNQVPYEKSVIIKR